MPGVQGVGFYNFFAGYYQEPKNSISAGAVDIERMKHPVPGDRHSRKQAIDAMHTTRNGAVIGEDLAKARGWKVGDRIPLRSNVWMRKDGAPEWRSRSSGIYQFADGKIPTNELWMNYDYFDEARTFGNGTVTLYFARIDDAGARGADFGEHRRPVRELDVRDADAERARLAPRHASTRSATWRSSSTRIIAAAMFALLFLTGNTMMQSVRERIPELAVLKTYGFGNGAVMGLVFGECAAAVRARGRSSASRSRPRCRRRSTA